MPAVMLLIAGLAALNLHYPLIENDGYIEFQTRLNALIRLDVNNLGNVLIAVSLLAGGAALFVGAVKSIDFPSPEDQSEPASSSIPVQERVYRPARVVILSAVAAAVLFLVIMTRLFLFQNSLFDSLAWLAVIVLAGYAIARHEKDNGCRPNWGVQRKDAALILLLIGGGLLVASFRLTAHPNLLMGDEGNFFDTARGISSGEYAPSFFDLGVYSYPVASSYWQAFILKLFGATLWSWRFSSVLISVLAVVPLYLLTFDLFGRRVAVLSSLSFLAAPWFLAFARLGYNNAQVFLPVTFSAWMLFRGIRQRSHFFLYLGGVAAGVGFLTYTAARISFVLGLTILGGWLCFSILKRAQRGRFGARFALTVAFLAGWAIAAGPHFAYGANVDQQSFRYKTVESMFINVDAARDYFSRDEIFALSPGWSLEPYRLFYNPKIYLWLFQRGFSRTILAFFAPYLVGEHFVTSPLPGPMAPFFFLIGLAVILARLRDRRSIFLLTWFTLVAVFLSTLNTVPPRHTHMLPILPVMAILTALGIDLTAKALASLVKGRLAFELSRWAAAAAACLVVATGLMHYFVAIPAMFHPDLDQTMNWAELSNDKSVPFIYLTDRKDWSEWRPFVLGRMVPDRPFRVVSANDYLQGKVALQKMDQAVFVFDSQNFYEVSTKLQKDLEIKSAPLSITNRESFRIGGLLIQGDVFHWPVKDGQQRDLTELAASPAAPLAVAFLSLGLIFLLLPPDWRSVLLARETARLPLKE